VFIFSVILVPLWIIYYLFGVFCLSKLLIITQNTVAELLNLTKPIELERFAIHTLSLMNSKIDNLSFIMYDLNILLIYVFTCYLTLL